MGNQTQKQSFPYSLRTIAADSYQGICSNRFFMYMIPPKDALTIEKLYCHFVMQFDSSVSASDRVVQSIGIVDELRPFPAMNDANYQRRISLNVSADASRRVDIGIDLSHLLKRENVAYEETGYDDGSASTGYTAVEILLSNNLINSLTTGTLELWKIDGLFTTTGIR